MDQKTGRHSGEAASYSHSPLLSVPPTFDSPPPHENQKAHMTALNQKRKEKKLPVLGPSFLLSHLPAPRLAGRPLTPAPLGYECSAPGLGSRAAAGGRPRSHGPRARDRPGFARPRPRTCGELSPRGGGARVALGFISPGTARRRRRAGVASVSALPAAGVRPGTLPRGFRGSRVGAGARPPAPAPASAAPARASR